MKKVTFRGVDYPLVEMGQWTYDEATVAQRVAGITVGQMALGEMIGDARAALGFAAVALLRADVDVDLTTLGSQTLDDLIIDFRGEEDAQEEPEEDGPDVPPAEAADEAAEKEREDEPAAA